MNDAIPYKDLVDDAISRTMQHYIIPSAQQNKCIPPKPVSYAR